MSKRKKNAKLVNHLETLSKLGDRVVKDQSTLSESKVLKYIEKRLKREAIEGNEAQASQLFTKSINSELME